METHCTECGMLHEVSESQKNSQMFCLGCDNFFRIAESSKVSREESVSNVVPEGSIDFLDEKEEDNFNKKIKNVFKKLFVIKKKNVEPELEVVLEADPPKMSEEAIAAATKRFALIDDFLEPETDFENEPEDVPAEYIDFLSVGLNVYSSDLIEHHGKNKADGQAPQKEQE